MKTENHCPVEIENSQYALQARSWGLNETFLLPSILKNNNFENVKYYNYVYSIFVAEIN